MDEFSAKLNTSINNFKWVIVNELEPFCEHHGVNSRKLIMKLFDKIDSFE